MNDSPESITPPPLRRFRNPNDLALVTRIMLALWIGSGVAVLVADATVLAATLGGSAMTVDRAVEEAVAAAALAGFASVGTGVAFIVWTRRVYTNLEPLGAMEPRYGTGWAIAGWVVPILNYWRPKQIINDAWRAADPTLPLGRNTTWHDAPVARVVDWWWALFLASSVGIVATVVLPVSTGTAIVAAIVDVVRLGAAVLAATVVARLSRRQTSRSGTLRASWWGEPLEPATSGRRWWPAVAVGSTILALGWSLIPFPQTVSSVAPIRLEAYGLSIEYPGNYTTDEAGVGAAPPSGAEGVFTAWRESPLELDGVALYWVQDAVTWDLDAPDIAVWLGEVTEHDDLEATIVRSGTAAVFGTVAEYRLLTADLGFLRGDGAYAVAGAWFPSCQRSVLFAVFEERGALGSVEQRLGEYLASFRCDMPPQGA
jgi:hypothetical protein